MAGKGGRTRGEVRVAPSSLPAPRARSPALVRRRHRKRVARIVADHWMFFTKSARASRFHRSVLLARAILALRSGCAALAADRHSASSKLCLRLHQCTLFAALRSLRYLLAAPRSLLRRTRLMLSPPLSRWSMLALSRKTCRTFVSRRLGSRSTACAKETLTYWRGCLEGLCSERRAADWLALRIARCRARRHITPARILHHQRAWTKQANEYFNRLHLPASFTLWRQYHVHVLSERQHHSFALAKLQQQQQQQHKPYHQQCEHEAGSSADITAGYSPLAPINLRSTLASWRELSAGRSNMHQLVMYLYMSVRRSSMRHLLSKFFAERCAKRHRKRQALAEAMHALIANVEQRHEAHRRFSATVQKIYEVFSVGLRWKQQALENRRERIARLHQKTRLRSQALHNWLSVAQTDGALRRTLHDWVVAAHTERKAPRFICKLGMLGWRWYTERKEAEEQMRRAALQWSTGRLQKRSMHHWREMARTRVQEALGAWRGPFLQAAQERRETIQMAQEHRLMRLKCLMLSGWIEVVEAGRSDARKEANMRASNHFRSQGRITERWRAALERRRAQTRRMHGRAQRAYQCLGELLLARVMHKWKGVADDQLVQAAMSAQARWHHQSKMEAKALLVWRERSSEWALTRNLTKCAEHHYMQLLQARSVAGLSAHMEAVKRSREREHSADAHWKAKHMQYMLDEWKESIEIDKSERQALDDAVEEYWSRVRRDTVSKILTACFERRRQAMNVVAEQEADVYCAGLERVAPFARRWKRKALHKDGRRNAILKYFCQKEQPQQQQAQTQRRQQAQHQHQLTRAAFAEGRERYIANLEQGQQPSTSSTGHSSTTPMEMLADVMAPLQEARQKLSSSGASHDRHWATCAT